MTSDEALRQFGLPASPRDRDAIRRLLAEEIERQSNEDDESDDELFRTLCVQLFSIGVVEDALLIWEAKESSFDAHCGLDVQLMCGAGFSATETYLASRDDPTARQAVKYLRECRASGDFDGWSPEKCIADYRKYFRLGA